MKSRKIQIFVYTTVNIFSPCLKNLIHHELLKEEIRNLCLPMYTDAHESKIVLFVFYNGNYEVPNYINSSKVESVLNKRMVE